MASILNSITTPISIESGLDFILSHFKSEELFPRRISTRVTEGRQITVKDMDEAIARFKQSNLLECRISAYPFPVPEHKSVNRHPRSRTCSCCYCIIYGQLRHYRCHHLKCTDCS